MPGTEDEVASRMEIQYELFDAATSTSLTIDSGFADESGILTTRDISVIPGNYIAVVSISVADHLRASELDTDNPKLISTQAAAASVSTIGSRR